MRRLGFFLVGEGVLGGARKVDVVLSRGEYDSVELRVDSDTRASDNPRLRLRVHLHLGATSTLKGSSRPPRLTPSSSSSSRRSPRRPATMTVGLKGRLWIASARVLPMPLVAPWIRPLSGLAYQKLAGYAPITRTY